MRAFPIGACGDATVLLGRFLKDRGFGRSDYVCGWRDTAHHRGSHAWIRMAELTIDITADQFEEVGEEVIVRRGSTWHDRLEGERLHEADFAAYDPYNASVLGCAYAAVLTCLSEPSDPTCAARGAEVGPATSGGARE